MTASNEATGTDAGASPLACPQCREVDQVQHVPAVHQGGRVSYRGIGPAVSGNTGSTAFATPYHGVATSAVSAALNPAPPIRGTGGQVTLGVLGTVFGSIALLIALSVTLASDGLSVIGVFWTWIWPALGAGMSVLGFLQYSHRSRANAQMRLGSQRVLEVWTRAWFCHRCGGVFFPESGHLIPLHAFRAHLWQIGDYRT